MLIIVLDKFQQNLCDFSWRFGVVFSHLCFVAPCMNNSNLGNVSSVTLKILKKLQLVFHWINGYPLGRNFFWSKNNWEMCRDVEIMLEKFQQYLIDLSRRFGVWGWCWGLRSLIIFRIMRCSNIWILKIRKCANCDVENIGIFLTISERPFATV